MITMRGFLIAFPGCGMSWEMRNRAIEGSKRHKVKGAGWVRRWSREELRGISD